jgi:hypothetical protein
MTALLQMCCRYRWHRQNVTWTHQLTDSQQCSSLPESVRASPRWGVALRLLEQALQLLEQALQLLELALRLLELALHLLELALWLLELVIALLKHQ